MEFKNGQLLRIFLEESDKNNGESLYQWIVAKAAEMNLSGATVLRGVEGFGANKKIHTSNILTLSLNLPVIIEIVDSKENIEEFIEVINPNIKKGLITIEDIKMRFYG